MRGAIKASVACAGKAVLPTSPASSLVNQGLRRGGVFGRRDSPENLDFPANTGEKCRRIVG
jgi:hypothetical protein